MNVIGGMFKDEKKRVIVESNLRLLLKFVRIFEVLEFIIVWVKLKNYNEQQGKRKRKGMHIEKGWRMWNCWEQQK
jgi:hypothetical protein